ncbi:oxidoreductase [Tenacibaculum sp. KUL113]|uniref:xanthine dehydrogenase family protein molybdopterin-binding subunit n=1 Tax=Alteromonas sp. KUL150 TaxID=2480805 RepID=UPI0012E617B3|nr:xanthine dehydrogenase family protein molybdopterin-binding subunit [Alteromonas sp. KUL150]GFD75834.1 oxidoreductase [Tenacibaculum sp. KUL113]GFD87191.1 oxidoreductase [Alteromonas sp. KUL150]
MTTPNSKIVGSAVNRIDGVQKVTGQARYAAEQMSEHKPLVGWIVASDKAVGKIISLETGLAEQSEGVHAVVTYRNAGPMKPFSKPQDEGRFTQSRAVLNEPYIRHFGAPVALVIADTLEQARYAASLVDYTIEGQTPELLTHFEGATQVPDSLDGGFEPDATSGNKPDNSDVKTSVDSTYTTPSQISAAMEPHATVAEFKNGKLEVFTSVQIIAPAVQALAVTLEMDPDDIVVQSPFIGGGFGSKLGLHYDATLACIGARYVKQAVKVVLSRRQVFYNTPHRGHSTQQMTLSANSDGALVSIVHKSAMPKAKGYEFAEATGAGARVTYQSQYIESTHRVKDVDLPLIDSTRSPGDAIGSLAFESAIDELAHEAGVDPLTFRLNNLPIVHPMKGTPFTSHNLGECLRQGAQQFKWQHKPQPSNGKVIGHGVASAMRMNVFVESSAQVEIDDQGKVTVRTDMTDIGTGTYTILAQIAADALQTSVNNVTVQLGDSRYPASCGSGGSFGAASTGSAVKRACEALIDSIQSQLPAELSNAKLFVEEGKIKAAKPNAEDSATPFLITDYIPTNTFPISATGKVSEDDTSDDEQYSCGAHFAEVEVDTYTGEVRLLRQYGMFSAGQILNIKTASSQIKGGMVWGAGYALTEGIHHHEDSASFVNPDFGEYHIAVNRDVAEVNLDFLEEPDYAASPVGAKGIGELGITGAGAAIANAIFDATKVRVRDFPITMDKIISG